MLLDYLFLPALFLIGLITSYQDFRYGKIKNKWIILGLVWGLGIYILFFIWSLLVPYLSQIFSEQFTYILPSYLLKVFINSVIALIVGYLLWYFNAWSAGDAKLFFIFSLLLPLKYYWKSALPYFPSFALLINTFISLAIFLFLQSIFFFLKQAARIENWRRILEEKFFKWRDQVKINWLSWLKVILGFGLVFLILQIIRLRLTEYFSFLGWHQALIFFFLILMAKHLSHLFKKRWFILILVFVLVFYLVYGWIIFPDKISQELINSLRISLYFFVGLGIFNLVVTLYIREIKIKHLPFAIWMAVGTLITIILKGSLISLFLNPAPFFE